MSCTFGGTGDSARDPLSLMPSQRTWLPAGAPWPGPTSLMGLAEAGCAAPEPLLRASMSASLSPAPPPPPRPPASDGARPMLTPPLAPPTTELSEPPSAPDTSLHCRRSGGLPAAWPRQRPGLRTWLCCGVCGEIRVALHSTMEGWHDRARQVQGAAGGVTQMSWHGGRLPEVGPIASALDRLAVANGRSARRRRCRQPAALKPGPAPGLHLAAVGIQA